MKTLSVWASRHAALAVGLIILGELANGLTGIVLGASLFNNLPLLWLAISALSTSILVLSIHTQAIQAEGIHCYRAVRRWAFTAFAGSFLLSNLLGGLWAHRIQYSTPTSTVLGSRRIVVATDSLARPDTIQQPAHPTAKTRLTRADNTTPPRIVYILLGLAGIAVAYVLAGLACNVLCAGYGFGALLTFYLGLGGLAGSFYYFRKALQRSPRRRRDMTADERKRDSRRFWLSWLVLIGIATITLLISVNH